MSNEVREMSNGKKTAETLLEREKAQVMSLQAHNLEEQAHNLEERERAGERAAADKKLIKRTSKELRASRTQVFCLCLTRIKSEKERYPPRQKSRVERLKQKWNLC